jgi:tetratricopeptide (TPR) repeat protein
MARADRRRNRRTASHAVAHRGSSATLVENELFFTRLRRQAKWIFVVLAVIFGGSFVVFGVGSEVPGGIADVLGRSPGGAPGVPSVSEAREELEERPNDPEALRNLATALQAEGETEEAIRTLEQLVNISPRDESALRELATLYLARAGTLRQRAQQVQLQAQLLVPDEQFLPPPDTDLGRALRERPVSDAVRTEAQENFSRIVQQLQEVYANARNTYATLSELVPNDPTVQLQLADAAMNSGDTETAIQAFERFLELAPNDPSADLVRQELDRLRGTMPEVDVDADADAETGAGDDAGDEPTDDG